MSHVGAPGLHERVVVDVNDTVEIAGDNLGDIEELVEVKRLLGCDKAGESNGRQIAHGNLVRRCVLHNLRAKVATLDGAKILWTAIQNLNNIAQETTQTPCVRF